jgi:hypothetical protein
MNSIAQNELDFSGRDEGIKRAVDHAEREAPGWQSRAVEFIARFARANAGEFFVEDIRTWAHNNGLDEPPHARAWGAAILLARKRGLVTFVEYRKKPHDGAHKTPASVWRRTGASQIAA